MTEIGIVLEITRERILRSLAIQIARFKAPRLQGLIEIILQGLKALLQGSKKPVHESAYFL